jgi:hypothetical protein
MTAIYDHLGNYLGDDGNPEMPTTSVDQMRYELSMMPLRPDGSDVPYTAQELRNMPVPARQPEPPRPYSTATNVAQAVADRLGLSAIPQAALGMASSFPAAIAKELGYPRVAEALQYTPSSRAGTDILEAAAAAPEAITGSHMGFGPLAEYWVPKSGFGLQSRPVITPSDVSVLGGRAIARGREVAAIPEDFRAAQAGLQRESDLGGPTYGARLQDVTEGLGDYLARQEAMRYSYEPSGSVQVFGNMVPEANLYAVRPSGTSNQVLREVPTPLNPRYNVSGESRLTGDLAEILDREEPTTNIEVGTRVQPFTNFVPNNFDKSANDLFRDFIMPKLALEFPGLQNENLLRAAQVKYGTGLQDWMKAQIEEFAQLPEVKAYNKAAIDTIENDYTLDNPAATLRDVMIVPPSVELAGAQAAENWVMQNMQNYMTEYLGTEADPALQEVMKSGKTVVPQQELEHFANDNARTAQGYRTRAGLPTEGIVRPQLVNVSNERTRVEQRLEQIQNEFNALVAANPGTRPADIPGIKELYKEQKTLTKVKDKLEEQAANLKKAVMYEDYMDARVRPVGEKALVEDINPTELQRFPMIPTNKELMYQMYVPDAFKELGREIVNKLEAGLITPEAAKNLSVPTAIKMKAELTIKKEKLAQEAAKLETEQLKSYIIEETQTLPQDGQFGKGTVVKFDQTLSKEQMERALSSECDWMDHCIGRGGSPDDRVLSRKAKALGPGNVGSDDKYAGYVPMIAPHKPGRVVPKGSSGTVTSYMKEFLEGKSEGRSFRDTATGVPFATMKLTRIEDGDNAGKYRINEFYGYKDRQVDGPWYEGREGGYSVDEKKEYRQVIADWANDHSDQLKAVSNDHLYRFAQIYDGQSTDHKNVLAHVLGVKPEQVSDIVQQVGKRFVTEDEAKAAKIALKEAPTNELEALKETKADLERAIRNGNFIDDEEEMVLRSQLQDINDEIRGLQQRDQVVPQQIAQVREYMTWVNDRHPDTQDRLAQITEDLDDLSAGRMMPHQHGLRTMADTEMFIRALGDEQRRLLAEQGNQPAPVAQVDDLDTQLFGLTNTIRENYGDTVGNVVDFIVASVTNEAGSINDNPQQWLGVLRQDSLNYRNESRQALDELRNALETAYAGQQPAQVPTTRPESINFLANDIVVPNAAFRNQTVEDIATSIRNQLLPTIERYNPTIPNDREALQRNLQFYQTSPLDADLGQGIEVYIRSNPGQENRIRESVADFMIQQIENRLGNRAPAPAQLPATTDAYATIRHAYNDLIQTGDIDAIETVANDIMDNQNGPYAQLTNNERTALRAQLEEGIRYARARQEPTPLSDIIQMDMNRIVDNYDEEVYNEVDGTLSSINDNVDLDIDPESFIGRIRHHADVALRNNDTTLHSIYENLAQLLDRTLDENNEIYAAREVINALPGQRHAERVQQQVGNTDLNVALEDSLNSIRNDQGGVIHQRVLEIANENSNDVDLTEQPEEYVHRLRVTADAYMGDMQVALNRLADDLEGAHLRNWEPAEDPGLALPVPAPAAATAEQQAMNEALQFPRFWQQRYPDLPQELISGILTRLHDNRDIEGLRENAQYREQGTIFAGIGLDTQNQAISLIDEIGNRYQNELQRLDNQPQQQEQYANPLEAYFGILDANNQFEGQEGLDTLRALPQLLRRQNLRQNFGIANLSEERVNDVIRDFEELYASRLRNAAEAENRRLTPPGPEGRKRGGLVESLTGVRSYSDLKREKFNRKYYDDGQAALDFELRHGVRSDQLGTVPLRKYSDLPPMQVPKSDEFLNFNQDLKRGGRVRRMNSGGVNKVRPTPNIPATPAKQNPNTTDYVPNKPVDKGFKETLEKIRGRSNDDLPDNYRVGGSISIDEMKYALMKGR